MTAVLAAVAVSSVIIFVNAKKSAGSTTRQVDDGSSRMNARILLWVLFATLLIVALAALAGGVIPALGPIVLLVILCFPTVVASRILVPLRLPRVAFVLTRLGWYPWESDNIGGAVLTGALAGMRQAKLSPATHDWLTARLQGEGVPLRGAGVAAAGFLAVARGDVESGRRLLASVDDFATGACPRAAATLALEWRLAEAASRGDWQGVIAVADAQMVSGVTLLLLDVARRLTHDPDAPGDRKLRRDWVFAGRWMATVNLLERALNTPRRPRRPRTWNVDASEDPVADALGLHAALLAAAPTGVAPEHLARVGRAWDLALGSPELRQSVSLRASELGARRDAGDIIEELARGAASDLAQIAQRSQVSLAELDSRVLMSARARLEEEAIFEVESICQTIARRVEERRPLPALDEWREWVALKAAYQHAVAVGGLPLRQLVFHPTNRALCSLAVWLWNDRHQRAVANAMFSWLLAEARTVDDTAAIELHSNNVSCGIY